MGGNKRHRKVRLVITYEDGTIKDIGQKNMDLARQNAYTYKQIKDHPVKSIVIMNRINDSIKNPRYNIYAYEEMNEWHLLGEESESKKQLP